MITCNFCYQFSSDDYSDNLFQDHQVCLCQASNERMGSIRTAYPDDDASTNFKNLEPSSSRTVQSGNRIFKNDTTLLKPLTTDEVLQDLKVLQEFPPSHISNGTPKNLERSKRVPRKLRLPKESKSSRSCPVEDGNQPEIIPDQNGARLSEKSTDSEDIDDQISDDATDDNLLLLPDALAMTRRSYETCFNSCFKQSASLTNSRRVLKMEELVTKTPSRSVWNFADGAQMLIKGADSVRPQVEGVLSSGLQFAAKKAQEEDMLRLVYIEAKIFKHKFAEVLKDKFPTDQVLLEQMWTNGRRDLHDRIRKPLPISNLMEMLWDSPNLDINY